MNKKSPPAKFRFKRTLFFLALSSLVLFIFSFAFFLFVSNDQINSGIYYRGEGAILADLTTITQKEFWSEISLRDKTKLSTKNTIERSFVARTDNLGTVAVPFNTHDKSINEKIEFRVKETNSKNWYYENTYNTDQFQNNIPFPFGFPVVTNSRNKSYTFQIEILNEEKPSDLISLSKANTYFLSKYKFSKSELIKDPSKLILFLVTKANVRLPFVTNGEIIFILLLSLSPFVIYYYRYKKKIILKESMAILNRRYPMLQGVNYKKYIFYATAALNMFAFFLSGLITRGNSILNLFITDKANYFMDFFNPLSWLVNGPYTYGSSIYPPLPLVLYRLLLRFIPFDIASMGALVIRASQSGQVVFLFYMLITLLGFVILLTEIKGGLKLEKYFFTFIILFSAPFLFQFERANIIFVALLFLMFFVFFRDSKNRIIRELALISLAISAGIKIYPAIFALTLIKERRFEDTFKVIIYSLALFILPFFAVGGINQLSLFIKNVLYTSDEITKWGVGYTVNIQNSVRILFAFLGDFGKNPIIIGRFLSLVILVLGTVATFFLRSKWKTGAMLALLMILVPNISYEYTLIFMLIPLIMFLDKGEREKLDYVYLICFILIFIPFTFGRVDWINNGFGHLALPLTYGVFIQSIALLTMVICLITQGLTTAKPARQFLLFLSSKVPSAAIASKISSVRKLVFFDKFYWIIPVLIILIYNLTFFNRYFPITEGWFSTYAWLMNHGEFPYKDFYFFLTPFYLIKMSLFTALFGYDIISLRIFGIGVILLTTYFLYKNFEILFGSVIAAFVAVIGMIYYQSGVAHITYDFTQFVTLYGIIQSFFLLKYAKSFDGRLTSNIKLIFLAGLFAGFTFLTKQSNGLMITIFSFIGLLFISLPRGKKELLRVFSYYISGFITPLIIVFFWLLLNSAFLQFIQQVFTGAIATKGGVLQIFTGWIKEMLTFNFIVRFIEISLVVIIFGYWINLFKNNKKENEKLNTILLPSVLLTIPLIIILLFSGHIAILNTLLRFGQIGIGNITVAAVSVSILLILIAIALSIFKKPFNKSIVLFSFISLGFIFGTGTTAGLSEAGAFAGFCLFVSLMLYYKSILGLGKFFIILFCIGISVVFIEIKYERPYYWWNATTADVRGNLQTTGKINMLYSIYTSNDNIKLIEEINREIQLGSKPGEPVLTFPNIPIFYLIADRKPPGKALVYWFDFLPDKLALKEAKMIRKNPPKVIVYFDLGDSVWKAHENLFREGRPSGQRKIVEAFMDVIKSKKMHVSRKYELPNNVTLTVWRN